MLISAYFPLKKVGGNRKSEEKSAFESKKSKRKLRNPQNTWTSPGCCREITEKITEGTNVDPAFEIEKSKRKWKEPQEHLKAALLLRYESLFGKKWKK